MSMSQTPVLIVDDEPSVLEGLQEFLEDEGYDVHLSGNSSEALGAFERVKPEVVVMDLRMPGLSGIEVIRQIREINEDIAIIVITGYGSFESAVDAIRLNVFDFISKPIDLDQFKASLDRARDSMKTARKIQKEIEVIRERIFQAKSHLEMHSERDNVELFTDAGQSMAGILHNLNNPLNYIMGQTQILQMIYPEMKVFKKIDKQASRMAQIIQSVLRKFKDSKVFQEEWLDFNQLLKDEITYLESHPYFQCELRKEWHLDENLPKFKGVAADFAQIFGNILCNAAEAMKGQAIKRIIISTDHKDSEITITVEDNGPGIPEKIQDRIFDPFFSTKSKELVISGSFGTGLGLYSCRQLVAEYGGSIEAISKPCQGAVFVIRLPVPGSRLS
jgi:signal transduction histidine kinase